MTWGLLRRKADFIIGTKEDPYLLRWYIVPRNNYFNIYLHKIVRSDDDRALHDHPWWNFSWILCAGYVEVMVRKGGDPSNKDDHYERYRNPWTMVLRKPEAAHRLVVGDTPAWSLFLTGPRIREWGFYCPKGWRHWLKFSDRKDGVGYVTKGCE